MSAYDSARLPTDRSADSRESGPAVAGGTLDRLLLRAVDAGLIAGLFAVPFIMGGRIAWGQLVLVALSLWVAVCWCVRQCLRQQAGWVRTPAGVLILAALGLVGLQLVSFPPPLLNVLSSRSHETLWLWAPDSDVANPLGVWSTVSMTPAATRDALVLLLAFALLFLATAQRVRRVEDAERLIRWIAVATVAMAAFALVQYVTNNGKLFWFFAHPSWHAAVNVQGSFSNRNHFAQFIALGIGPLVWWVHEGLRSRPRKNPTPRQSWAKSGSRYGAAVGLRAIALGFTVFVGLLSLSRGGAVAMFVAGIVCLVILYRGALVSRKTALSVIGAGLIVAACLQIFGYEMVAGRLNDFESVEKLDGLHERRQLWQADAAAVADYPLLGTGLGSHREVCPTYMHNEYTAGGFEYSHAENGYLQVAMETGLPGLLLALSAVGLCLYWCLASLRRNSSVRVLLCFAAITPALAANFAHSAIDFVWYVPGCMVVVVILAACACRLRGMSSDPAGRPTSATAFPRVGWIAAALCLAAIGYCMVRNRLAAVEAEPSWHRYLSLSRKFNDTDGAKGRHDALCEMADELSVVVDRQPDHARAHIRLAEIHLKLFDHAGDSEAGSLDVRQVREAVLASRFESSDAMYDWLRRAFGERQEHLGAASKHARRGLALCPLQGKGYLYLADLSFLEGPNSPGKAAYVKQAVEVRPFDGTVLFAAGQEAFLAGDPEAGLEYWKASYQSGPDYQESLLQHLAPQTPAPAFLEMFPSDLNALKLVLRHYRRIERPDDLRFVLGQYTAACEAEAPTLSRKTAAQCWADAAGAYWGMGDLEKALECLRQAAECDMHDFETRRAMGLCLYKLKQFEEAEQHLTWCLRRKPGDGQLRSQVQAALSGRLRMSSRSAPDRK
ncbi:MAG TPA: O-antigen ligase family protein [Thermoguttaceae bacterium]|nr:O-antigen ligase family protein [Thermoguttaceae bacterium]